MQNPINILLTNNLLGEKIKTLYLRIKTFDRMAKGIWWTQHKSGRDILWNKIKCYKTRYNPQYKKMAVVLYTISNLRQLPKAKKKQIYFAKTYHVLCTSKIVYASFEVL